MMRAVKNSPMARAAPRAIVIESSIVILRSRRFWSASLKMGYPPTTVATSPTMLTRGKGSQRRNQTAPAASATKAIRARSDHSRPWSPPSSCSCGRSEVCVATSRPLMSGCLSVFPQLLQVGPDDVDDPLGLFGSLGAGRGACEGVHPEVLLHELCHEAVHRSVRHGYQVQD